MKKIALLFTLAVLVLIAVASLAQTTGAGAAAGTTTATTAATATAARTSTESDQGLQQNLQEILEEPATSDTYRYDPQGRRDPFRSLVGPSPKVSRENAPPGPPGFLVDEIDIQGVVKTRQGLVAMITGPDNNGYLLRVGDKVFDGEVIRITPDSVVFRQEVNDPTKIERFREVVKELKSQTEKKGRS